MLFQINQLFFFNSQDLRRHVVFHFILNTLVFILENFSLLNKILALSLSTIFDRVFLSVFDFLRFSSHLKLAFFSQKFQTGNESS